MDLSAKPLVLFGSLCILAILILNACTVRQGEPSSTPAPDPSPTPAPIPTPTDLPRDTLSGRDHPVILAHFMSWYEAPPKTGWGSHWTGNGTFLPGRVDDDGRAEIASQVYPLSGPYDSRDADILEYQMLLMKIAGIEGVIVDWYGNQYVYDYGPIHKATQALLSAVEDAGLIFSVCYEDRTVTAMTQGGKLKGDAILTHGQDTLQFLQASWFQSGVYPYYQGRPLLFIFGPIYFTKASDWDTIFSELASRPYFITLDNKVAEAADAGYPWVPMHTAEAGVVAPARWQAYLDAFYQRNSGDPLTVGAAFPQFHDIYAEIGGASYGYLDAQAGETFNTSLQMAVDAGVDIIQLITWNDYGEGTVIEPTREFDYMFLESIQAQQRQWQGDAFPYSAGDLRLPLRILELRRADADSGMLDQAVSALYSGDSITAGKILDDLSQ